MKQRPWSINEEVFDRCLYLFPTWLKERGGIVVYQNQMFDSRSFGDTSFLPKRFIATDGLLHEAPDQHFPDGDGLPSLRQQKADLITLEEFDGDVGRAIGACFEKRQQKEKQVERKAKTRGAAS